MKVLERHSGDNKSINIFDCAYDYFNLSNILFRGGCVNNIILHQIIYGIVKLNFHEDSLYYHATSGIDFHNPFNYLLKCLDIWVGMCYKVTNFILCDIVVKNCVTFTKIISTMIVTNLCNLKIPSYINVIHHHPNMIILNCLAPGTSKVWSKHGVRVSEVRGSIREILDDVVANHGF